MKFIYYGKFCFFNIFNNSYIIQKYNQLYFNGKRRYLSLYIYINSLHCIHHLILLINYELNNLKFNNFSFLYFITLEYLLIYYFCNF